MSILKDQYSQNVLILSHNDTNFIKRAIDAIESNTFFAEFVPLNGKFAMDAWGVKEEFHKYSIQKLSDNKIIVKFYILWFPPIRFYKKILNFGFNIVAYYYIPNVECGLFDNGKDQHYKVDDEIPYDIDRIFKIKNLDYQYEDIIRGYK